MSPHRATRPWSGAVEAPPIESKPQYDPNCYLCPRNTRAHGQENPNYSDVFVFDNDFPALSHEYHTLDTEAALPPFLRLEPAVGTCRVICYSPRHDLTMADLDVSAVGRVIACWADQTDDLRRNDDIGHIMIFENNGAMMGASNPHPHGQLWATDYLPNLPLRASLNQQEYFESYERPLLIDYAEWEVQQEERVVWSDDFFVILVPWWAVWPFECMIVPRFRVQLISELSERERLSWANGLLYLLRGYNRIFNSHFPYSMGVFQRPLSGRSWTGFQLHQQFFPPLLRSAEIRKFMVGFELCAEPQRDSTPEQAARKLREAGAASS